MVHNMEDIDMREMGRLRLEFLCQSCGWVVGGQTVYDTETPGLGGSSAAIRFSQRPVIEERPWNHVYLGVFLPGMAQ